MLDFDEGRIRGTVIWIDDLGCVEPWD